MPADTPPAPSTAPAPVYPAFGALGIGMLILFTLRLAIMLGPGGDKRVAFFDACGVAMALVPTWGLVLWKQRRPLKAAAGWLFGALLCLSFLPPLAYFVRS